MRLISIAVVVSVLLIGGAGAAHASAATIAPLSHSLLQTASPTAAQGAVPSHSGSRVGVQLVVLGCVAGLVVIIGSCAYFIRKRLGLTAPPPGEPPAAPGH
jgi:hypothetical protein